MQGDKRPVVTARQQLLHHVPAGIDLHGIHAPLQQRRQDGAAALERHRPLGGTPAQQHRHAAEIAGIGDSAGR